MAGNRPLFKVASWPFDIAVWGKQGTKKPYPSIKVTRLRRDDEGDIVEAGHFNITDGRDLLTLSSLLLSTHRECIQRLNGETNVKIEAQDVEETANPF